MRNASSHLKVMNEDKNYRHTSSSTNFSDLINRKSLEKKTDLILSAQLTFRQCVNILHYCRLLFKHLVLMSEMGFGDDNQRSIFKRWLSTILKTLKNEIDQKKVKCEG